MEKAPENSSVPWVAVMEGLTGVTLDDIIDSLPKGSTPNRKQRDDLLAALTEIAELDILKYHHAYAIAKGAIEEIEALKCSNS